MATFFQPTKKETLKNKEFTLTINRLDPQGCGVGLYQKKSVFVENTLPGEVVQVKVVEQNSKFIKATLLKVITESIERDTPPCKHFVQCGGCDLQHLIHSAQLDFKQKKVSQLFERAGFDNILPWQAPILGEAFNYRRKARIGVQYNKHGEPIVGFRKRSSNNLITIKQCSVLEHEISTIFPLLNDVLKQLSANKSVGHIEVIHVNITCVVIRQLVNMPNEDKALWLQAAKENEWNVFVDNGKVTLPLIDNDARASSSTNHLFYPLLENTENPTQINFSSDDFIQVNDSVNQQMVEQALTWLSLSKEDHVLDLFCGLGNFSLPIAKQVTSVIGVEGVEAMVNKAMNNAEFNKVANCQFYQADLNSEWNNVNNPTKNSWHQQSFNKILLDPARAGAEEAVQQLAKFKAEKIVYISCEPSSLARDAAILIKQGYKIKKITLMDMFSQTKHIETMVLFEQST